jgi:uncharacterized membrane protein YgdD (TMEM256/DUF423 family)
MNNIERQIRITYWMQIGSTILMIFALASVIIAMMFDRPAMIIANTLTLALNLCVFAVQIIVRDRLKRLL